MNVMVIQILAIGLTLGQIFNRPLEKFKESFNPDTEQAVVEQLLKDACENTIKDIHAENVNLEVLVSTFVSTLNDEKDKARSEALAAASAPPGDADGMVSSKGKTFFRKMAEKVDPDGLLAAYRQFCKNEPVENSPIKIKELIEYYNKTMANLPRAEDLKGKRLKGSTVLLDRDGKNFTEIYAENNRRKWISLSQIPEHVKRAFIAAEDKRFIKHDLKDADGKVIEHIEEHHGVDLRGVLRAFMASMASKGRPQGGSTITQQVAKNLSVGDDATFERKIRELITAARIETILSKDEILELYLNLVFLGRSSWGVEMAAQSYFGKSIHDVDLAEASFLAALTRGPNAYNPDLFADKMQERREYVLSRMLKDQYISEAEYKAGVDETIPTIDFTLPRTRAAFYFLDEIQRDAKRVAGIESLTSASYLVRSTLHPGLQKAAEAALQDGLADYEIASGGVGKFAIEGSIADDIAKFKSTWQDILPTIRGKLWDIQWPLATVVEAGQQYIENKNGNGRWIKNGVYTVGLADGRKLRLSGTNATILHQLHPFDLVYVKLNEGGKTPTATIRVRPRVQGAMVVLEAKTGRVLAMTGGFSYAASQLNRVTRSSRQPGSTLKPFIYLSALNLGFQPNTLIPDIPLTLPPIERGAQPWSPHNYDGHSRGIVTIRRAIEQSLNLPTARIMSELGKTPSEGLDYIRGITQKLGIYQQPIRYYPFVLGAQPARLLDMAVAYATVANIGLKPTPHFIDSIEQEGKIVYQRPRYALEAIPDVDRVSFYQIRHILEGTVERGTAVKLKDLAGYVAGKTGTSNNMNDAWFIGFTNDLVVATWIGYDNKNIRASLGSGNTGGHLALPIGEKVLRESFNIYKEKELLSGPPTEIQPLISEIPIDPYSGNFNAGTYPEIFRLTRNRQPINTRRSVLKPGEEYLPMADADVTDEGYGDGDNTSAPYDAVEEAPTDSYQPGADDMYDLWNQRGRQVDSMFVGRPAPYNQ